MKGRMLSGRCMSPISWASRTTTWASSRSSTVISRSTSRTSRTRPRSSSIRSFRTSTARRQPRSQRTPRRSMSGHWKTTIRPSGSTARIRASRFTTSEPCWPIRSHSRPPVDSTVTMGLRRLLGRGRSGSDGDRGAREEAALDLADIQGFVLRGYAMPMVRHFLLTVGTPGHARRQLGRLVSGDESDVPQITTAEDWHVGFAPGPGDDPAAAPRRKPDYCLNVGITWPGLVALEIEERLPTLSFRVVRCVRRRSRASSRVGRRYRIEFAPELDRRVRKRRRSRPGDAARHQPGGDDEL